MVDFSILPALEKKEFSLSVEHENLKFRVVKGRQSHPCAAAPSESVFGLCNSGKVFLEKKDGSSSAILGPEMYFSLDSSWTISSTEPCFLIYSTAQPGLNVIGGPLELRGRLKYIDNCTDSLLIPPTKWGDPCLNLLVFPPSTQQTAHHHPSFRAGLILSGSGTCVLENKLIPLSVGDFFFIPPYLKHCFRTESHDSLRVLAFHPDSDFGPTDQIHPMINKTIIQGR